MMPDVNKFSNTKLVRFITRHPQNRHAWDEFYRRFDDSIRGIIWRLCVHSKEHFGLQVRSPINDMDDFVQDVYVKITQNNLKALRDFKGKTEESIYAYLNVIAHNVLKNHFDSIKALKRRASTVPIDSERSAINDAYSPQLIERLKSFLFDTELIIEYSFLMEEIEQILLKKTNSANKERDLFLFKLSVFDDFTAEEIAHNFPCDLTAKRIGNIVATLKQNVRSELFERFSISN